MHGPARSWPRMVLAIVGPALALAAGGCVVVEEPLVPNADGTVSTVAGTGAPDDDGDGGLSRMAALDRPMDVAVTPEGDVLIADFNNHRVRRIVAATGIITTIAGDGTTSGTAALIEPSGVTPLAGGGFIAVSWGGHQVFQYGADGSRTVVAGTGTAGCEDSDASASDRVLSSPRSADVLADGSVLVAEQGCHRVWRIRVDGTVVAYAGNGEAGYSGDDGDAHAARLQADGADAGPCFGLSLSPEDPPDELFIADTANHVVRVVKPFTGRIETFAGTGVEGFLDGPPEQAMFNRPTHVFCGKDHSVWIVDAGNHAIRYIDPLNTRVETVIGTGAAGFNGDGLPPHDTMLNEPSAVWATPDGVVFVADAGNHRVRMFRAP